MIIPDYMLVQGIQDHLYYESLPLDYQAALADIARIYDPGGYKLWCCPIAALRVIEACGRRIAHYG